jgi:hypothetical protein
MAEPERTTVPAVAGGRRPASGGRCQMSVLVVVQVSGDMDKFRQY